MKISKDKKKEDWLVDCQKLKVSSDRDLWANAYSDYFYSRLESRYLNPIKILQRSGSLDGEGFSIVAIQCSLIEFLESTYKGINYKFLKNGDKLSKFEYSSSGAIFKSFLTQRNPFDSYFNDKLAEDFYISIRCGVLHEAATKNGWKIHAKTDGNVVISETKKIIYRDNFQNALIEYARKYGELLVESTDLQAAFIRKYDYLCTL